MRHPQTNGSTERLNQSGKTLPGQNAHTDFSEGCYPLGYGLNFTLNFVVKPLFGNVILNSTKTELVIDQKNTGYRYSIEPFLLADFMTLLPGQSVLDIGTGCGIIPLLTVHRQPTLAVTAIETQDCTQAQKNIHKNAMGQQITLIQGDFLKEADNLQPESFPYCFQSALPEGSDPTGQSRFRQSPGSARTVPQHEFPAGEICSATEKRRTDKLGLSARATGRTHAGRRTHAGTGMSKFISQPSTFCPWQLPGSGKNHSGFRS